MNHQPVITDSAQNFLARLVSKQPEGTSIRFLVHKGGTPYAETSLAFCRPGQKKATDHLVRLGKLDIWLEGKSLPYLKDMHVDLHKDQHSERLLIDTPAATKPLKECDRTLVTNKALQASLIPSGNPIQIPAQSSLKITQALGSIFTLQFQGNLIRLSDADARELDVYTAELNFTPPHDGKVSEDQVWQALKTVYDPEIPVNIVSLGLVYQLTIKDEVGRVELEMTLTAPGCGMGEVLVEDVRKRLNQVPFVRETCIELVFDPPWCIDRMSEEARLETGLYF